MEHGPKTKKHHDNSCWIRVVQPWASADGARKFPFELPKHAMETGIKSRSSKGGSASTANVIRLDDEKGKEELLFQAERDHKIIVRRNRLLSVGGNDDTEVDGARTMTVTAKNTETYEDAHEVIAPTRSPLPAEPTRSRSLRTASL
ncbi:MAG TPA: hypothetical protein VI299_09020 [Polyangiales bacterium]